jgi:hypothetical protein
MEAQFRSLLADDAAIAALVGARIYWNAIPQTASDPCVVMYVISRLADAHHGGANGLNNWLVQIDVRALTFASAIAVRDAIVAKLHAKRFSQGGLKITTVLQSERQRSEKPGTTLYHQVQLDFSVWSGNA